ncbi:thioredoxin-like domain-containing protein [Gemmatimonadota bacterium]
MPTGPEPASLSELFGNQLYRADGSAVGVGILGDDDVIGIYFADPGCPACRAFTPILVDAYDRLREDGRSFEVVLVTAGISELALFDFMVDSGMPWLAISSQSSRANALAQRYDVRWIPTLVIIDGAANTLSLTGREELTLSGAAAYDAWLAASAGS